jgi:hypothetical protein
MLKGDVLLVSGSLRGGSYNTATATGLSRQALSGNGRDAQSTAFLRPPRIEPLYAVAGRA